MKKTNMFLISATALISGAFLFSNQTNVSASGIATTHDAVTFLYTDTGKMVSNRALAPKTPWVVGKTINLDGTTYYQVATNEYVKAGDVDYANQPVKNNVTVTPLYLSAPVYSDQTNSEQQFIKYGSFYKVGRVVENEYGQYYYQISSHGWVIADLMEVKGDAQNIEHIDGFFPIANADRGSINPEDSYNTLVDQGADPELASEVPDEVLQYDGIVVNWLGEDAGAYYRKVSQIYQLQY